VTANDSANYNFSTSFFSPNLQYATLSYPNGNSIGTVLSSNTTTLTLTTAAPSNATNTSFTYVTYKGKAGDTLGETRTNGSNIFLCTASYSNGASNIWTSIGNSVTPSLSNINNGTSNVKVATNGNITAYVAGNANAILTITSTGANIAGTVNITGNLSANYVKGNIIAKSTSANVLTLAGNVGQIIIDTANSKMWVCVANTTTGGSANWKYSSLS